MIWKKEKKVKSCCKFLDRKCFFLFEFSYLNKNNPIIKAIYEKKSQDYFSTFTAGNSKGTSWHCLGQLFTHSKFLSHVWCDPLILG